MVANKKMRACGFPQLSFYLGDQIFY